MKSNQNKQKQYPKKKKKKKTKFCAQRGLLGDKDAKTLVHKLVYLFIKYFALRSGKEHSGLTWHGLVGL